MLLGEPGTGKTTLLTAALRSERCRDVRCIYLNNPALTTEDLIRTLAARFEIGEARESKAMLIAGIERLVRERRGRGEITALVVDEAQSLSDGLLEEIRLLANIETATEKLLPLVLAGLPTLGTRLEEPGLRQVKQRVSLRCELGPFELRDTAGYIGSRIATAGGDPSRLFTMEAVKLIHEYSGGVPRTVNVICDNALTNGMALDQHLVDRKLVLGVCRDLRLQGENTNLRVAAVGGSEREATQLEPIVDSGAQPADVSQNSGGLFSTSKRFAFPWRSAAAPMRKAEVD